MANILKPGKSLKMMGKLFGGGRTAPKASAAQVAKQASSRVRSAVRSNDGPKVGKPANRVTRPGGSMTSATPMPKPIPRRKIPTKPGKG